MEDEHLFLWPILVLNRELTSVSELNADLLTRLQQTVGPIAGATGFNL